MTGIGEKWGANGECFDLIVKRPVVDDKVVSAQRADRGRRRPKLGHAELLDSDRGRGRAHRKVIHVYPRSGIRRAQPCLELARPRARPALVASRLYLAAGERAPASADPSRDGASEHHDAHASAVTQGSRHTPQGSGVPLPPNGAAEHLCAEHSAVWLQDRAAGQRKLADRRLHAGSSLGSRVRRLPVARVALLRRRFAAWHSGGSTLVHLLGHWIRGQRRRGRSCRRSKLLLEQVRRSAPDRQHDDEERGTATDRAPAGRPPQRRASAATCV